MKLKTLEKLPFLPVLGILLAFIVGAALGGMYVKIQYLEGKAGSPAAVAPTAPSAAAPSAPSGPTTVSVKLDPNDPIKGNPNAKLTIVEFADYQCPYCAQFQTDTLPSIIREYVDTGKAKFAFKNLAFLGQESKDAANAALCANEQNKFWEFHDKLFTSQAGENQGGFAPDKLKGFAAGLGLNTSQFNSCVDSNKYAAAVAADTVEANKNGFQSTPSVAVGSTPVVGAQPYAQFKTAIDAELAKL